MSSRLQRRVVLGLDPLLSVIVIVIVIVVVGGFACGGGSGGRGFPPPVIPASPSAEDWPDIGVAITDEEGVLSYDLVEIAGRGRVLVATLDHWRRLKILSEVGLRYAHVELPMDAYTTVTRVEARSVSRSGQVRRLPDGAARALQRADQPKHDDLKTLAFDVPGVEVGGILDYRYTRVFLVPDLVPPWVFGDGLPAVRSEFSIVAAPGLKIDYRYGQGGVTRDVQPMRRPVDGAPDKERWVFVEQNVPPYYDEPDMGHRAQIAPFIAPVLVTAALGREKLRMQTWEDVGARLESLFQQVGGESSPGTPEARYARVRDNLSPLTLFGMGILKPTPAEKLLARSPACPRDAGGLLIAAFEGANMRHFPALIASPKGPPLYDDFPALYPFLRAGVAVDVSERVAKDASCREDPINRGLLCSVPPDSFAFLDPLCSFCRFGELPTELTGGKALVLVPDRPRIVRVPPDAPEKNRSMLQFRWDLDVRGHLKGSMNGELVGVQARRVRNQIVAGRDAPRDVVVGAALFGAQSGLKLESLNVTGPTAADKPLELRAELVRQAEKVSVERYRLRPIDFVGATHPERVRKSRRLPVVLDGPLWNETVAAVELPVGYAAEDPEVVKIVRPFAEYAAGFVRRERTLSYSRRFVLKQNVFSPSEWREVAELLEEIGEHERRGVEVWLEE